MDDERLVDWAVIEDNSDSDLDGDKEGGSAEDDDEDEEWKGFRLCVRHRGVMTLLQMIMRLNLCAFRKII